MDFFSEEPVYSSPTRRLRARLLANPAERPYDVSYVADDAVMLVLRSWLAERAVEWPACQFERVPEAARRAIWYALLG